MDSIGSPAIIILDRPHKKLRGRKLKDDNEYLPYGVRSILVVKVELSGGNDVYEKSEEELANTFFGPFNAQIEGCSHGKLRFIRAANRVGDDVSIINGSTTLTIDNNAVDDNYNVLFRALNTELESQFNVVGPYELADHVAFCMPKNSIPMIGRGNIKGWASWYEGPHCLSLVTKMHEFGHNFDLLHSNEPEREYFDTSGAVSHVAEQMEATSASLLFLFSCAHLLLKI